MFKENYYPSYKIERNDKTGEKTLSEVGNERRQSKTEKKAEIKEKEMLENAGSYIFEGQKELNRRDFLKYSLGSLAGILFLKKYGTLEKAANFLSGEENPAKGIRQHFLGKIEFIYDNVEEIDPDSIDSEIYAVEADESLPLKFNLDAPINIGLEDVAKAKNYWKDRYTNGSLRKDFEEGLARIRPYESKLKDIFRKNGVPKDLIYISLAESFFDPERTSRAGAKGAFQLMPKTARDYHLVVNEKIDERKDILKSAEAAARILRDNHAASRDWDMAFSGYNWGKFWKYPELKKENSFEKYVRHFSQKGENIRRQIRHAKFIPRKITKNESLYKLANIYQVSEKELQKYNHKKSDKIKEGEIIKIPLKDKKQREHVFRMEIAGYQENFNYVPKVRAILEAVKVYTSEA